MNEVPRYILENMNIGDLVSIPIKLTRIEEKYTSEREPYLMLHGVEREGNILGPLRIWQHAEHDVGTARILMLRGMKVDYASTWDETERKYIKVPCWGRRLEACAFTAIEDVSQNPYMCKLFSSWQCE